MRYQEQLSAACNHVMFFCRDYVLWAGCSRRLGHMAIDEVLISASDD